MNFNQYSIKQNTLCSDWTAVRVIAFSFYLISLSGLMAAKLDRCEIKTLKIDKAAGKFIVNCSNIYNIDPFEQQPPIEYPFNNDPQINDTEISNPNDITEGHVQTLKYIIGRYEDGVKNKLNETIPLIITHQIGAPATYASTQLLSAQAKEKFNILHISDNKEENEKIFSTKGLKDDVIVPVMAITMHGLNRSSGRLPADRWLKEIINPLSQKIKAKVIIVESCYGATLIPELSKLLAPEGIIIGCFCASWFSIVLNTFCRIENNDYSGLKESLIKNIMTTQHAPGSIANFSFSREFILAQKALLGKKSEIIKNVSQRTFYNNPKRSEDVINFSSINYSAEYLKEIYSIVPSIVVIYDNKSRKIFFDAKAISDGISIVTESQSIRNLAISFLMYITKGKNDFQGSLDEYGRIDEFHTFAPEAISNQFEIFKKNSNNFKKMFNITCPIWGSEETLNINVQPIANYDKFIKQFVSVFIKREERKAKMAKKAEAHKAKME
jgi:hypothetical protein